MGIAIGRSEDLDTASTSKQNSFVDVLATLMKITSQSRVSY